MENSATCFVPHCVSASSPRLTGEEVYLNGSWCQTFIMSFILFSPSWWKLYQSGSLQEQILATLDRCVKSSTMMMTASFTTGATLVVFGFTLISPHVKWLLATEHICKLFGLAKYHIYEECSARRHLSQICMWGNFFTTAWDILLQSQPPTLTNSMN